MLPENSQFAFFLPQPNAQSGSKNCVATCAPNAALSGGLSSSPFG